MQRRSDGQQVCATPFLHVRAIRRKIVAGRGAVNTIEGVTPMSKIDQDQVVAVLNRILEAELAGVVRYTHYSFLVFGFGRIPIVSWLREQANESLLHAQQVGEWITTLGAYPSLAIGALLDSHQTDIAAMLRESLEAERRALDLYRELLVSVEGRAVGLEEFARQMVQVEELHAAEVDKMLRKPGDLAAFSKRPG
jgi:bacterioferritin